MSVQGATLEEAWHVVVEVAAVRSGTSLLDLGCGTGGFCAFAALRGAGVHGVDVDPDAIAQALEDVPEADFRLGLMEDLPWPEDSFDVVTGFNAVQYALDPEMALGEARRVARREGRIAMCKWGPPAENEFFAFLISLGAGGVSGDRLPAGDPLEDAIRATRIEVLDCADLPAPIHFPGEAQLYAALKRAGIEHDSRVASVEIDISAAAAPYRRADGSYRFENRLRYWIARP